MRSGTARCSRVAASLLLLAAGAPIALGQEQQGPCTTRTSDLRELISCLRSTLQRANPPEPATCATGSLTLVPPVDGRRVLSFGERTQYGSQSKGVVIETTLGAPVVAPAAGVVLFGGEWRSYGKLIIIDAGCRAEILVAGVDALAVAGGEHVDRKAMIGKMSERASTNAGLPVLYYELRENGSPVNPER
jgi:murein hydrolase activator